MFSVHSFHSNCFANGFPLFKHVGSQSVAETHVGIPRQYYRFRVDRQCLVFHNPRQVPGYSETRQSRSTEDIMSFCCSTDPWWMDDHEKAPPYYDLS